MTIYQPSDDSFMFVEFLEKYFLKLSKRDRSNLFYLDMGTGSGILLDVVSKFLKKKNIFGADINPDSAKFVKKKGFKVFQSDLFSNIPKKQKFDLITFNAPYLPQDEENLETQDSKLATTGGKKGDEISLKFISQAKPYLNKNGKIFLLISSLTPINKIKNSGFKIVVRKKIFFEELLILEFSKN